jgi:exodeoxyribonuclease VII large subunit
MSLANRPILQNPCAVVDRHALRLDYLSRELGHAFEKRFTREHHVTERLSRQLKESMRQYINKVSYQHTALRRAIEALSPYAILSRGYAVLRKKDGDWVTRAAGLHTKDAVEALFSDGSVELEVTRALNEGR